MVTTLYFFVLFLNLILEMLNKKSKSISVLSILYVFLVMGGNNLNSDYDGYMYFYTNQRYPISMEKGYVWLANLASANGLAYQTFVQLVFIIALIVLALTVTRYTQNYHGFIFLYISTMMFLDVIQIRQFVAYIFLTIAIIMQSKGKRLRFVIFVLLGALMQITTLVYLPIFFMNAKKVSSRRFMKRFFCSILCLCLFVFIGGNKLPFLSAIMSRYISADKMIYFSTSTHFGFLENFAFQIICIYLASITRNYLEKIRNNKLTQFANSVYIVIVYSSFAMPLVMLNNNFSRFFKFGLIGLFMCCCCMLDAMRDNENNSNCNFAISKKYVGSIVVYRVFLFVFLIAFSLLMQSFINAREILLNNMFM